MTPKFDNDFQELIWSRARIAEMEAELADALPALRAEQRMTARAEGRLAAVTALHDSPCTDRLCCSEGADHLCGGCHEERPCPTRAAATGDNRAR